MPIDTHIQYARVYNTHNMYKRLFSGTDAFYEVPSLTLPTILARWSISFLHTSLPLFLSSSIQSSLPPCVTPFPIPTLFLPIVIPPFSLFYSTPSTHSSPLPPSIPPYHESLPPPIQSFLHLSLILSLYRSIPSYIHIYNSRLLDLVVQKRSPSPFPVAGFP